MSKSCQLKQANKMSNKSEGIIRLKDCQCLQIFQVQFWIILWCFVISTESKRF